MQIGDLAFFYHSSCETPGIVGIIKIIKAGYPDKTAFDPDSPYFDAKTKRDNPRWFCVDVQLIRKLKRIITLAELQKQSSLKNMRLLQRGNRLSITPITSQEWDFILSLE